MKHRDNRARLCGTTENACIERKKVRGNGNTVPHGHERLTEGAKADDCTKKCSQAASARIIYDAGGTPQNSERGPAVPCEAPGQKEHVERVPGRKKILSNMVGWRMGAWGEEKDDE